MIKAHEEAQENITQYFEESFSCRLESLRKTDDHSNVFRLLLGRLLENSWVSDAEERQSFVRLGPISDWCRQPGHWRRLMGAKAFGAFDSCHTPQRPNPMPLVSEGLFFQLSPQF